MTQKVFIWRYDAETPTEQFPWIVSCNGLEEPSQFRTYDEAVEYVRDRIAHAAEPHDALPVKRI